MFPAGAQNLNRDLAFTCRDKQVTYFNGQLPVFTHPADDLASFRLFTTQLIINGVATQGEVVQAFGVSVTTVKRYVKKYRQGGSQAIFVPPRRRTGTKLTPELLAQAQELLDHGQEVPAISRVLGVLATTLHKAIRHGRLRRPKKKVPSRRPGPGARRPGAR